MCTIASRFSATVMFNRGDQTVDEILHKDHSQEIVSSTKDRGGRLKLEFTDGSKAVVKYTDNGVTAEETTAYIVQPFVKAKIGGALVFSNGCEEVFIEYPNGKKLRISSKSDGTVVLSGVGSIKRYDGFSYTFN